MATLQPYLDVTVVTVTSVRDNCGRARYVYGLSYDEAELAGIIGHEMIHACFKALVSNIFKRMGA